MEYFATTVWNGIAENNPDRFNHPCVKRLFECGEDELGGALEHVRKGLLAQDATFHPSYSGMVSAPEDPFRFDFHGR